MNEASISNPKFLPLFAENRAPVLIDGSMARFDLMTRKIVDIDGNPIPMECVQDPGHLRTRYYVYFGGRGGAKSHSFALALILRCLKRKTKALCCREIMSTIADSVKALLERKIETLGVSNHFDVLTNEIRCELTDSSISFRGLRHNINELKSFEDADICWVEEAGDVSDDSWTKLDPTIRAPGSEVWVGFNTDLETDPTYQRFILEKDDDMTVVKVYWYENTMLDIMMVKQALKMKERDPEKYAHVWGGEPRRTREGGVFVPKMITLVDAVPAGTRYVRGWDLAGTAIDPRHPDREPAWTAGVKLGRTPAGRYVIVDVDRFREKPHIVEQRIAINIKNDGWGVEQSIPQDPGQAGKAQVAYLARRFAGARLHFSPETGRKEVRAGPFAAQVNVGNVDMLRAAWNQALINEMESFSGEEYGEDKRRIFLDQIDALSRAFARLQAPIAHREVPVRGL